MGLSRSTSPTRLLLVYVLLVGVAWSASTGAGVSQGIPAPYPIIKVVYPRPGQVVTATDSTFIFGHVDYSQVYSLEALYINGVTVNVHPGGGFLAYLPVTPGRFTFRLEASFTYRPTPESGYRRPRRKPRPETAGVVPVQVYDSVTVTIPNQRETPPVDTLVIVGEYQSPAGDLVLSAGDLMRIGFRGTPGCRAWCEIPGVIDSVPMTEESVPPQTSWGEAVFGEGPGEGSNPKTGLGVYVGFYPVTSLDRADSVRLVYHLATPEGVGAIWYMLTAGKVITGVHVQPAELLFLKGQKETVSESTYRVTLNSPRYPCTVRFTDSVQIVRHGPRRGYLSIFQPAGVEALAVGAEGEWYRIRLSSFLSGWVHQEAVEVLPAGNLPPKSFLTSVRTFADADRLVMEIPLSGRHPFRVIEESRRAVRIQLFGVTSNLDWIRYDFQDSLVRLVTWWQPEDAVLELKLELTQDIWGYDTYFRGNVLCFQLNRPPRKIHSLKGKRIVIDPGHSSDSGAVGPTGYTEAEANLALALELRKQLRARGATVIMTRDDNRHVDLYERPAIAKAADADLFISIHNNALPDGVNPFINNGTSSYYYHPHSMPLARCIHAEMLKATGLADHGLYHGNLAVLRPTQYPAVLVECAFMMIPEQEALLKTDKFRRKVAGAVAKGIARFLEDFGRD